MLFNGLDKIPPRLPKTRHEYLRQDSLVNYYSHLQLALVTLVIITPIRNNVTLSFYTVCFTLGKDLQRLSFSTHLFHLEINGVNATEN